MHAMTAVMTKRPQFQRTASKGRCFAAVTSAARGLEIAVLIFLATEAASTLYTLFRG